MSEVRPEALAEEPGPGRHCWHRSPAQHSHIKAHADIRCCHCGEDRCVPLKHAQPPGHGLHAPAEEWKWVPKDLISATGCPREGE